MRQILARLILMATLTAANCTYAEGPITNRPISDWLENNPTSWNFIGPTYLLNLGWNPHGFPKPDGSPSEPVNWDVFFTDPFAYPYGFDSILASVNGLTVTTGSIKQIPLGDGGVRLIIHVQVTNSPMSLYYSPDVIFGPNACSSSPTVGGPGCTQATRAILGQDADGSWDYTQQIVLDYTPAAVARAGGDLAHGVNPTIPFFLAIPWSAPGITIKEAMAGGVGTGTFTPYAANFGFTPGATGLVSVSFMASMATPRIPAVGGLPAEVTITEQ